MPYSQNPIFVGAATGTVGRRLVPRLTEHGETVRAATRSPEAYDGPDEADPVLFDYLEPKTWPDALGSADRAFLTPLPDTAAYGQLNSFLDALATTGIEHVVFMTAMGMDQAPDEMPLRSAELALIDSSLDATILRPNWFAQNFTTYWRGMIEADGVMRLPAGDGATSFVDAEDIAAVAETTLIEDGHADEAYTLTGPEALTYHEAAEILSEAWNREVQYEPVGDEEAHRVLTANGFDANYAEMLIGLLQDVRAGHAAPVTEAVENVTGHPPRSLKAYAEATAEAMA